jgi:hypothetical protein
MYLRTYEVNYKQRARILSLWSGVRCSLLQFPFLSCQACLMRLCNTTVTCFMPVCSWSSRQKCYFAVYIHFRTRLNCLSSLCHLCRCLCYVGVCFVNASHEINGRSHESVAGIPRYWCLFGRCVARRGQPFQRSLHDINSFLRKLTN